MTSGLTADFFTDENALGLGKLLCRQGRGDVVHPGHVDFPEVPLGTPDLTWMPIVARFDLVVVTRDRRIRTRPAELRAYVENGIKSVWLGGKQDLGPADQLQLFLTNEKRLRREMIKLGAGPWALALSTSGVRPLKTPSID